MSEDEMNFPATTDRKSPDPAIRPVIANPANPANPTTSNPLATLVTPANPTTSNPLATPATPSTLVPMATLVTPAIWPLAVHGAMTVVSVAVV
ncbi:MAG: hypothetical protein K0U66_00245 [Gammaproteobacteria bacterium]|nr:hypothetical protein [Gammaproteobacteria bacterium]